MESWGHEVIVVGDKDVDSLIGLDIVAYQEAEGGAMGYPGGVFFVTSDKRIFFTSIWEQMSDDNLLKVFPPLAEVKWGLIGRGTRYPEGWHYEYLGMGNHLLVREDHKEPFIIASDKLLNNYPDTILYNLWLEAVLSIL